MDDGCITVLVKRIWLRQVRRYGECVRCVLMGDASGSPDCRLYCELYIVRSVHDEFVLRGFRYFLCVPLT